MHEESFVQLQFISETFSCFFDHCIFWHLDLAFLISVPQITLPNDSAKST